jgi:hypothetical protein
MQEHGKLLRPLYWEIRRNYSSIASLKPNQKFRVSRLGAVIEKKKTGAYPQRCAEDYLRVSVGGKFFFLKITNTNAEHTYLAAKLAKEALKSVGGKVGPFNIEVIFPHFLFQDLSTTHMQKEGQLNTEHSFIVSDFFSEKEVVLLKDAFPKGSIKKNAVFYSAVNALFNLLGERGVQDVGVHNIFYAAKTKTLLLFDLRLDD